MGGDVPGIERWKALWPLVLLALAVRVSFGSLALPQAPLDRPLEQLARVALLCDGQKHDHGAPAQHHPADAGEGVLLLDDALASFEPSGGPAAIPAIPFTLVASVWCFPPVRGPPLQKVAALYAQGPPV